MASPITKSRSKVFIETGKAVCSVHGEHADWGVVDCCGGLYKYARCRKCTRLKDKSWKAKAVIKDPIKHKLYRTLSQARKDGKDYAINKTIIEQLLIKQDFKCALTGQAISASSFSIDRIDSSKGYVLGNIWLTTIKANYCKQVLPLSEFIQLCKDVVATHGSK